MRVPVDMTTDSKGAAHCLRKLLSWKTGFSEKWWGLLHVKLKSGMKLTVNRMKSGSNGGNILPNVPVSSSASCERAYLTIASKGPFIFLLIYFFFFLRESACCVTVPLNSEAGMLPVSQPCCL